MGSRCERTYMRNKHTIKNLFVVACIISSLFVSSISAFAVESGDNSAMRLSKVQGTVAVLDKDNKPKKATENMKLINENKIVTNIGSYAWGNLDSNKLVKLDALSKVKITKDEKNLTVDVSVGKVFVDVSKDLEKDESLIIRTQNVTTSIKGKKASAEISIKEGNTTIVGLDGKLDCVVTDVTTGQVKQVTISSGKKVDIQQNDSELSIVTKSVTKNDISGFSMLQIAQDSALKKRIVQSSGSNIGKITEKEAVNSLSKDMDRQEKELAAMAKEAGMDSQSVINAMMGADVSSKNLGRLAASTQNPSSDTTPSTSDGATSNGTAADSEQKHTHNYTLTSSTPASCTNEGSNTYSCNGCGAVNTETIPKIAHDYEEIIIAQPTCIAEGSREFRCRACGYSITETLNIIEHSYNGVVETREDVDNPYNCQDYYIVESKYCTMCESYIEQPRQQEYPEHSMDGGTEISPATCTEPKRVKYQCTRVLDGGRQCSYCEEYFEGPLLEHTYEKGYDDSSEICYRFICNTCEGYGEGIPHTLGDTSGLPSTECGDQYIKCAESGCNMYAKYSWNAESELYVFTGSWENRP